MYFTCCTMVLVKGRSWSNRLLLQNMSIRSLSPALEEGGSGTEAVPPGFTQQTDTTLWEEQSEHCIFCHQPNHKNKTLQFFISKMRKICKHFIFFFFHLRKWLAQIWGQCRTLHKTPQGQRSLFLQPHSLHSKRLPPEFFMQLQLLVVALMWKRITCL